jgi:uncharacterized protein YciI
VTRPHLLSAVVLASALALPWAAAGAPALFAVVTDELDPGAPSAALPAGPVDQALVDLRHDAPQAVVLVPRREDSRGGVRYAYAAWRVQPDAPQWDSIVVVALPEGARVIEATSTSRDLKGALTALVTHALESAAPAPPAAAVAAVDAPLPLPDRWDLRYAVLLERDPAWAAPADAAAAEALTQAHIQYTLRLQRDGLALAAGPLVPGTEAGDGLVGLTLLRVKDLATAQRIAAEDPAVKAGRLKATVREWRVPAGRLP